MSDDAGNDEPRFELLDRRTEQEQPDESAHGDLEELFDLLADPRRRHVLSYLCETTVDAVELADVVAAVVARESDPDSETDHYEAVAVDVHHTYLPELEAAGLLEYDARSRSVRYRGHPKLGVLLALASEDDAQAGEPRQDH